MNDFKSPVPDSCVLAWWLCTHPDQPIMHKDGTLYVYDSSSSKFLYRNPKNAVRNGWYVAGGMRCWFDRAWKYFPHILEDRDV